MDTGLPNLHFKKILPYSLYNKLIQNHLPRWRKSCGSKGFFWLSRVVRASIKQEKMRNVPAWTMGRRVRVSLLQIFFKLQLFFSLLDAQYEQKEKKCEIKTRGFYFTTTLLLRTCTGTWTMDKKRKKICVLITAILRCLSI